MSNMRQNPAQTSKLRRIHPQNTPTHPLGDFHQPMKPLPAHISNNVTQKRALTITNPDRSTNPMFQKSPLLPFTNGSNDRYTPLKQARILS
jgi:hypothetical protein